ncbi:MAG: DNA mismatch repair endonuclease MutL [Dehalococcoidia bacterium]|nr:DNA mismatch repair endonuclease MutL [Dehalococcoidia bacterium]
MTAAVRGAIRVLAPEVAARIAAGEVVERPVSVVRELLDNAIDAGATRISLEIQDGGLTLIKVSDDGRGIEPEELELAFERHATSKIAALDDLGHVHTLGFRGEALPSIAAAADLEVVSRVESEPVGVLAVLVEGKVVRRQAKPSPRGTTIAVRELFARVPARRKFLGSAGAEARQVVTLASHYALAYPGIAFHAVSGGRRALVTSGDGDMRHAFAAIYGAEMGAAMLDVDFEDEAAGVKGLCGPSSVHRGNRAAISFFVNGRWVQSRPLTFALIDAYQSQLPIGRHPVAALHIALPDEAVDVNVHPAKAEVRFRDERAVGRAVRRAVSAALEASRVVAWEQPRPAAAVLTRPLHEPVPEALRGPQPVQAAMNLTRAPAEQPSGTMKQRAVLPMLRVVGQLNATYVICEGPDGMYLLDQHAAHERVVYDRLISAPVSGERSTQPLLEPFVLELEPAAAATLEEHRESLARLGLETEPFGDNAALIRSAPAGLGARDLAGEVRALLQKLESEQRVDDPFGKAAATVACHASVRAGMLLSMEEMRRLVEDLERTASPRTCPHGRPTLVHLGTDAIERQFGRR